MDVVGKGSSVFFSIASSTDGAELAMAVAVVSELEVVGLELTCEVLGSSVNKDRASTALLRSWVGIMRNLTNVMVDM
jgi:hypothetical protein